MAVKLPPVGQLGSKAIATNADNMVSAGLSDDFDGYVEEARIIPYDYEGKQDHVLALRLRIVPDEDSGFDPFYQYYSCGAQSISQFAPSIDGEEPLDVAGWDGAKETLDEVTGICFVPIGTKTQMNKSSNYGHFSEAVGEFLQDELRDVRVLENRKFHWNRLPQRKRTGIIQQVDEQGRKKGDTILLPTEDKGVVKPGKAAAGKTATAAAGKGKTTTAATAAAASSNGGGEADEQLEKVIRAAVDAAGGMLPKAKLSGAIIKGFKGDKQAGVKRVAQDDFWENSQLLVYDAEEQMIYANG